MRACCIAQNKGKGNCTEKSSVFQSDSFVTKTEPHIISYRFTFGHSQPSRAHTLQAKNISPKLFQNSLNSHKHTVSLKNQNQNKNSNVDLENPTHSICAIFQRQTVGFLQSQSPPKLCRFLQPFQSLRDPKSSHSVNVHHFFEPTWSLRQIFNHYPQQARRL